MEIIDLWYVMPRNLENKYQRLVEFATRLGKLSTKLVMSHLRKRSYHRRENPKFHYARNYN